MKVLLQWATDPASDWVEIDSRDWIDLPKKPVPPSGRNPLPSMKRVTAFTRDADLVDPLPGWVHRVNVQGVIFHDDHIAVVHREAERCVTVYAWSDDPEDFVFERRYAAVWNFYDVSAQLSIPSGSGMRTELRGFRQEQTIYCYAPEKCGPTYTTAGPVRFLSYADFVPPDERFIRHGVWMLDSLVAQLNVHCPAGYLEWQAARI